MKVARGEVNAAAPRRNSPVFVIGCHRSGTALLYDSLLSAGGFPIYHASPYLHTTLLPICGNPSVRSHREKLFRLWLRSKAFRRTGFDAEDLRSRILNECETGGDFLKITMEELANRAGAQRWALHDCDNILCMPAIKHEISNALFIHVVRDGRDAALSMRKQHVVNPRLWPRKRALFAWALLWQWTVRKGRRFGQEFADDYIEVRYEDLVRDPAKTLAMLGEFLDHDLDYGRIQRNAIGRLLSPNTVWGEETHSQTFSPIGRWKAKLSQPEINTLEGLIGGCLKEFSYPLTTEPQRFGRVDPILNLMRASYPRFFEAKLFLQSKTVVGRLANGARLELSEAV
ncbi:MAG: sulfotransferase [Terriglobales bacterium]